MRVISCELINFASYKELKFNFTNQGLALIHGPTGSGKSTLCDAIPWVLFGRTAKGGAVDEVLSWGSNGEAEGTVTVSINPRLNVQVRRTRGKTKDLWVNGYDPMIYRGYPTTLPIRGKDLNDTQKIINKLIGIDLELYLAGSYFHEFSQTAQFFTTTAKIRRAITEQLVDLSLPIKLQDKVSEKAKEIKEKLLKLQQAIEIADNKAKSLIIRSEDLNDRSNKWQILQSSQENILVKRSSNFIADKDKKLEKLQIAIRNIDIQPDSYYTKSIEALQQDMPKKDAPCTHCGAIKPNKEYDELEIIIEDLKQERVKNGYLFESFANLKDQQEAILIEENPYDEQLLKLKQETNPYLELYENTAVEFSKEEKLLNDLKADNKDLLTIKSDLETLSDITAKFRGILIENTVLDLQTQTNLLLERHFDSEIRLELAIEDADKLNVTMTKDGNTCSYTQLSKGQRQLLKLCFGVAVMKAVANHHGIKFHQVFLDEALDGLDEVFKVKAYGLLEALSLDYESVFVVEHSSELKSMFDKKFKIALINGESVINGEN